jgi:hypothetical protein
MLMLKKRVDEPEPEKKKTQDYAQGKA